MPTSAGQKTEKPTRRKRRRAREQGMVAQSTEVNNTFVLLAGVLALALFGGYTLQCIIGLMVERLGNLGAVELTQEGTVNAAAETIGVVVRAVMPVMVLVGSVGVLCSLAQTGVMILPKKLAPNLGNIDPIRGMKNIFSLQALMRLLTAALKVVIIGLIVYFLLRSRLHWLAALVGKSPWGILHVCGQLSLSLMLRVVAAMMAVAVLDYCYQRWRYQKQLMMTTREVKEERRRDEGDPEVRARQATVRRTIARQRMMQAVPEADVVVANPGHIAVALQWDERRMSAPTVVAKGQGYLAERIKRIARENNVPVLERKELARMLYEVLEVGMEIPPKLYYAVAEVLAFVLGKKKRR